MSHLSLDLFCSVSILECVVRVFVAEPGRTDIGDHHCATVSPEGVLQKTGQLAVAIRNVDCLTLWKREGVLYGYSLTHLLLYISPSTLSLPLPSFHTCLLNYSNFYASHSDLILAPSLPPPFPLFIHTYYSNFYTAHTQT